MNEPYTILIADRNSHVRMFLMRELMAEGYRVQLAATAENVLKIVCAQRKIDLVVLDPDLPGVEADPMLAKLEDRLPDLPIVLHTHRRHDEPGLNLSHPRVTVVEKAGDSVERIKEIIENLMPSGVRDRAAAGRGPSPEREWP